MQGNGQAGSPSAGSRSFVTGNFQEVSDNAGLAGDRARDGELQR